LPRQRSRSLRPRSRVVIAGVAALVVAGVALAAAVSASGHIQSQSLSGGSGTLTLGSPTPPVSMNPVLNGAGQSELYMDLAYASLIRANPDGSYSPNLAASYRYIGSGNRKFEIVLQKGLKFSDGTPLNSQAVKTYLNYVGKANGPFSADEHDISNIATPNATTVVLSLNAPNPAEPYFFSEDGLLGDIVSPKALAGDVSVLGTTTDGAGPYELNTSETVTGSSYVYTPNPYYYAPSQRHFAKVVVKIYASFNTAFQALQSRQVQWVQSSTTYVGQARSAGLATVIRPNGTNGLFILDRAGTVAPAFGNLQVRQAINYALDRPALAGAIEQSAGVPLDQIEAPGFQGYSKKAEAFYTFNVAKAKSLLAQAGYPNGFTFNVVTDGFNPTDEPLAEAMAQELKAIGITMTITTDATFSNFASDVFSKKYPAIVFTWGSANMYYVAKQLVMPTGVLNLFNNSNPAMIRLYWKAAKSPPAIADKLWQQLSELITQQAWFAPAIVAQNVFLASKTLTGVNDGLVYPDPAFFAGK
jgi:ABC-type transport system substrate-binding protein